MKFRMLAAVAVAVVAAFMLSGCLPFGMAGPVQGPTFGSKAPATGGDELEVVELGDTEEAELPGGAIFATDGEALGAARAAFEEYAHMSYLVGAEGGVGAERMEQVAVGASLKSNLEGFKNQVEAGNHFGGPLHYDYFSVFQQSQDGHGNIDVTIMLCADYTKHWSKSPGTPRKMMPVDGWVIFAVVAVNEQPYSNDLVVSQIESYPNYGYCA